MARDRMALWHRPDDFKSKSVLYAGIVLWGSAFLRCVSIHATIIINLKNYLMVLKWIEQSRTGITKVGDVSGNDDEVINQRNCSNLLVNLVLWVGCH
jgi:hypothetical protein